MPRRKTTHKLDVTVLEQDVALSHVVGDTERENIIRGFCEMYSVPLSKEHITEAVLVLGELKTALDQETKAKSKK